MNFEIKLSNRLGAILEAVEDKAAALVPQLKSKKSRWKPKKDLSDEQIKDFIIGLAKFDPTGETIGTYLPYIVRQLSWGNLVITPDNDEDGGRLLAVLTYFHENKKKAGWPGEKDINQYKKFIDLEALVLELGGKEFETERGKQEKLKKGAEKVFEITVPNRAKTTYTVYKITEPEAAAIYGRGTHWCTTSLDPRKGKFKDRDLEYLELGIHKGYPNCAVSYLRSGALYIIFRRNLSSGERVGVGEGDQLMQFTHDGSQIMNFRDTPLATTSPALDWAFGHWQQQKGAPKKAIKKIRDQCAVDYEGRPPL